MLRSSAVQDDDKAERTRLHSKKAPQSDCSATLFDTQKRAGAVVIRRGGCRFPAIRNKRSHRARQKATAHLHINTYMCACVVNHELDQKTPKRLGKRACSAKRRRSGALPAQQELRRKHVQRVKKTKGCGSAALAGFAAKAREKSGASGRRRDAWGVCERECALGAMFASPPLVKAPCEQCGGS